MILIPYKYYDNYIFLKPFYHEQDINQGQL